MEVYAARQPIFDRRMNVYGYELLYRKSDRNHYEGTDDNQATAELLNNVFLVLQPHDLAGRARAFINFSEDLLEQEIPLLLPKDQIVVEILERVRPTPAVIRACAALKERGYMLALDDFVFHESYIPLMKLADMIKVEYSSLQDARQLERIGYYKRLYRLKLLAEKIETREEHKKALELGCDLFQGYFFSKPVMMKGKEIGGQRSAILDIMQELNREDPDYQTITEIIEKDLDLSYKLLKMVNTAFFGSRTTIYSIKQALVRFGLNEIKKWMYLLFMKTSEALENREWVKNSLIRAKYMELLSVELNLKSKHFEFFMTGLFSTMDVLLQKDMGTIVDGLPLSSEVKDALLGSPNAMRDAYETVLALEAADWKRLEHYGEGRRIAGARMMSLYIQAVKWTDNLEY